MKVAIVGAGTMGAGIAQVFLAAQEDVLLFDVDSCQLEKAHAQIIKGLKKRGQGDFAMHLHETTQIEDLAQADLAIEAAPEKLELKRSIFKELDRLLKPPKLIASNTSSLKISWLAEACAFPQRVVGMHFFNPVAIMRLVEVVRGKQTSIDAARQALEVISRVGKEAILSEDSPGFIVNRIMIPLGLEAIEVMVKQGQRPDDIDRLFREKGPFKMGPFELMDFIGLDVCLDITRIIYKGLDSPKRFLPNWVQEYLVKERKLGRKTRGGFYRYDASGRRLEMDLELDILNRVHFKKDIFDSRSQEATFLKVMSVVINEAFFVLQENVAKGEDINHAFILGANWPHGPFQFFDNLGPKRILEILKALSRDDPDRYVISSALAAKALV